MSAAPRDLVPTPELEQLRRLTEIGRALTYTTSLDQVAKLAVTRGSGLLDASGALLMLEDSGGELRIRGAHGSAESSLAMLGEAGDDPAARLPELLGVPEDRVLAVPLVASGAVIGLLAVALAEPGTVADEWLLSALADQAAVALEHARLGSEVRPELEDRLRASEGATSAKDRALATLAHDIRSPIGAIDGYCSNMEDELYGPVTEKQRHALTRVRMSGQHLLSLLESVMDMARLDAGAVSLTVTPLRIAEVAREAVDMLLPAAMARLQTLTIAGDAELVAMGDRGRLRQVLVNLIGNAVKFTPQEGAIAVEVTSCVIRGEARGQVRVTDTGPGIAASEQAAVFERYYRVAGSAGAPGIGLGLAISRALIVQMGGDVSIESMPGIGSTFVVTLAGAPARDRRQPAG